ncbi:MAG: glycosyltransferase family 2 protein, partial [Spirochaetes bacterium]|nr:glycosyltransferase family 2 protein [Spirochaetota bacterium]
MVSVIIPTFNRAYVLRRAVESVLSQSYGEYEIIIVDDGSTDDTARVLEHFKKHVRVFYSPHSGVSKTRNTGIERAGGEWISFLDSDDYWFSEKLEKQMSYLKNNPQYRVCHTDEIWIKNGKRINQGK